MRVVIFFLMEGSLDDYRSVRFRSWFVRLVKKVEQHHSLFTSDLMTSTGDHKPLVHYVTFIWLPFFIQRGLQSVHPTMKMHPRNGKAHAGTLIKSLKKMQNVLY